jgi:tetratricopeptide (TPR) repeat protein/NAD-dependent SIR2 family protein deacetylase
VQNLIFEISESIKKRDLAIFCGAGISWNSGLPLANELKQSILEKLPMNAADRDEVMKSNLPFEAFIETLSENTDISRLLDIFQQGTPNTNYALIAHLAKAGYFETIFTTNFDLLIERAIEKEGLIRDKDFRVYYDEKQFSGIDFEKIDDGIIRIFKLHGTVEARESIRTTLKAVASKTLSEKRMNLIRHLFSTGSHQKVLILGYSCSDDFDITPQIQSLEGSQKEIIFIDHSMKGEKTENIKTKDDKNPFKRFTGTRVICDTNKFTEKLWKSMRHEKYEPLIYKTEWNWVEFVDQWATGLKYLKYFLSGSICNIISNFQRAIEYYQQTLEITKTLKVKLLEAECYSGLGNAYHGLGNLQQAIGYYKQALKIAKAIGAMFPEAKCYLNLGIVSFRSGNFQQAIEYYKQALKITKDMGDMFLEARCYDELGIVSHSSGNFQQAIEYCKQALKVAETIGDKVLEAASYGNLGIAYFSLENFQQAIKHHQQDLEIAKAIGDRVLEARCYGNLGNVHFSLGNFRQTIKDNQQALNIFNSVGDKAGEALCYFSIGVAYCKLENFNQSIEYFFNAENLFIEINQIHYLKKVYDIQSLAYKNMGDINGAISVLKKQQRILMEKIP